MKKLNAATINRIAGQAEISPNTVRRWNSGKRVHESNLTKIIAAIEFLDSTRGKVAR